MISVKTYFRVVIALCGGNIDTTILGRCLDRGMAADGRLVKFSCTISDRPGGMAELTNLLYKVGVTIKDIQQVNIVYKFWIVPESLGIILTCFLYNSVLTFGFKSSSCEMGHSWIKWKILIKHFF